MSQRRDAVLQRLGKGMGLRDPFSFVGREQERRALRNALLGQQSGSVWIYGPRRIGKTSLVDRLREETSLTTLFVDAGTVAEFSAVALLEGIDEAGRCALGEDFSLKRTAQSQSISVVVDEFDRMCLGLSRDDRALLRGLTIKYPAFAGWVFVSCDEPSQLCREEDAQSYLPSICAKIQLGLLTRRDVRALTESVFRELGEEAPADLHEGIYARVGGFPGAVQPLLHAALLELSDDSPGLTTDEVLDLQRNKLQSDLEGLWRGLDRRDRAELLENSPPDKMREPDLVKRGLVERSRSNSTPSIWIKARWLREVGAELGVTPHRVSAPDDLNASAKELGELLSECDEAVRRLDRKPPRVLFTVGRTSFKLCGVAYPLRSGADLAEVVRTLHQVVVEGSKEVRDAQKLEPILLDLLHKHPTILLLNRLRIHGAHDLSLRGANEDLKAQQLIAEWYKSLSLPLSGPTSPEQLRVAQRALIVSLVEALRSFRDKLNQAANATS
jgi:hypothetical protein